MKTFATMLEAAQFAATLTEGWDFAYSKDKYDKGGLLGISQAHDDENPADEDSFYVVSPGGAIGFCEDGEDIDWLFLPDSGPGEDLPTSYQAEAEMNFCPQCGSKVVPGAHFCDKCGTRLQ